uniref:Secernin 3 n=1 Tax=Salmo trutta TaxID=8032 RepID=A0A674DCC9_SALTR
MFMSVVCYSSTKYCSELRLLRRQSCWRNCMEDQSGFAYHNSFLISDKTEAWMIEASGKYWAAEIVEVNYFFVDNIQGTPWEYAKSQGWWDGKAPFSFAEMYSFMTTARIGTSGSRYCEVRNLLERSKGRITAETMMDILRDKESGINMEGIFMTTGSMSVVLIDPNLPGVHYITGTPDPERSVFKPFVFVKDIKQLKQNISLGYGPDDTAKKIPRFQSKPHHKHPLFVKHQVGVVAKKMMAEMEKLLTTGIEDPTSIGHVFSNSIQ